VPRILRSDPAVAFLLLAGTLLSRIPGFFQSVLDWDESLYFLMAQHWRLGQLPYTTIWDNKPIGIYVIFAAFQTVFGDHIAAIRLATALFVTLLAFAVLKITEALTTNRAASLFAAVALILCALTDDGLSANTELFMACFTALAVWAALTTKRCFLVGLLLGTAFMIKYVAVFEAPFVMFLLFARLRTLPAAANMLLGAAVPLAAAMLLYACAGHFELWLQDSILSNFRRVGAPITAATLDYVVRTQLLRWGPLFLAALILTAQTLRRRNGAKNWFLLAWLAGGMVGVISAKSFYDHYFLQILPVLCVILGVLFAQLDRQTWRQAAFALAMLALPFWAAAKVWQDSLAPDVTAQIAADLTTAPGTLYVFDGQPIIYALTHKTPPTRFVLPSELTGILLPHVAGVDGPTEVARILATRPSYIVRRSNPSTDPTVVNKTVYAEVDQATAAGYTLWRRYPAMAVYKLKPSAAP
jgi:4-amino-4-deoxy-L-arabinose transferase-like glycosyltransferase